MCRRLYKDFHGKAVPGDESREADGHEGEEGHADGRRRRVGEQVVRFLAHVVRHRRRRGHGRYQEVSDDLHPRSFQFPSDKRGNQTAGGETTLPGWPSVVGSDRTFIAVMISSTQRTHLVSGEVDEGRRLPRPDQVPPGAEPVGVAQDLRRGVQPRHDGDAQAVAARPEQECQRSQAMAKKKKKERNAMR